jgi:hypothetical protein
MSMRVVDVIAPATAGFFRFPAGFVDSPVED